MYLAIKYAKIAPNDAGFILNVLIFIVLIF